jgi:radical SAM protein with 4Fe4S-binding SPASM domain
VTITHEGDIRFCVEDWFNKGVVGNVRDQSIRDIWTSDLYARFRELHLTGRWCDMNLCKPCMDWQHMEWEHGFEKAINRVLNRS